MENFLHINIVEIGLLFVAAGYLFVYWTKGGINASERILNLYKEQVDALEKSIQITRTHNHELGNQVQKLSLDVGILKGQLQERDKKLDEYMTIFQGRGPEQEQYMAEMRTFTSKVAEYMSTTVQTLAEISKFMQGINNQQETQNV